MKIANVAVVGAGLAGLVCASILTKNGIKVTVIDKGRKPGGRLASRDRDQNTFDYGAQYFTIEDARFRQFLAETEIAGKVSRWNGKFALMDKGCLTEDFHCKPRYVAVPAMRSLADAVVQELDCKMLHRVKAVSRQTGSWLIEGSIEHAHSSHSFSIGDYDFIVLNLPPKQAESLWFHPRLKETILMPCCATLLAFDERVRIDFDGIKLDDKVISWVARDSSKPCRRTGERWVIHASPDWSEEYFDMASEGIAEVLTERFATIFNLSLPGVHFKKVHKWRFALPISPMHEGCLVDHQSALVYCGDWCASARVEGAFISGLTAAEEIMLMNALI